MKKKKLFLLISSLLTCSCGNIKGNWFEIYSDSNIPALLSIKSESYIGTSPFNTVMYLKYFEKENETLDKDSLTTLYNDEVIRLHKLFDRHYYYKDENNNLINNVKVLNDSYGTNNSIKVSIELFNLIKLGIEGFKLTNGYFNIFTGSYTDFWNDCFESYNSYEDITTFDPYFNIDAKEELEKYVAQVPKTIEDIEKQITLNEETLEITFNNIQEGEDIKYRPIISVGGLAKGYATDLIKEKLLDNGYNSGMLFSGGSSISSLSKPIHSQKVKGQNLSVMNPETSSLFSKEAAFKICVSDEFSFSTSGNYTTNESYRFLDNDSNIIYRHHIIDPFTGYPNSLHRSVSLLSYDASNVMMDIFSTAFMNLSISDGLNLRNSLKDFNFELFYLDQEGYSDKATYKITYTSSVNNSFSASDNITLIYEK